LARPPRPVDPATGRTSPRVRAERAAIPESELRARRRAPAIPELIRWEPLGSDGEEK